MDDHLDDDNTELKGFGEIMEVMGRNAETLTIAPHNAIAQLYLNEFTKYHNSATTKNTEPPQRLITRNNTTNNDESPPRLITRDSFKSNNESPRLITRDSTTCDNDCSLSPSVECNQIESRMCLNPTNWDSPSVVKENKNNTIDIIHGGVCLLCSKIVVANSSKLISKAKCDKCDCVFCDNCYVKNCDIGGGQDQEIYFSCARCRLDIIRDKDLLEYFLRRCNLTKDEADKRYREWAKSGRGEIVVKYDVKERYSSW